jgi:hypothetical protein
MDRNEIGRKFFLFMGEEHKERFFQAALPKFETGFSRHETKEAVLTLVMEALYLIILFH